MRILPFVFCMGVPALLSAQTTLVAGVADARSGKPLQGAEVLVVDLGLAARTNWIGEARIPRLSTGYHRVRVRKVGYAASDIRIRFAGDTIGPVFMLEPVPMIDTVRVLGDRVPARLQEFEARRRLGLGRYLTSVQLDREGGRDFVNVVASHFPGVQVHTGLDGRRYIVSGRGSCGSPLPSHPVPRLGLGALGPRGSSSGGGEAQGATAMLSSCDNPDCPVRVYLDDLDLGEMDIDIVQTWDLAAVEYYTSSSVPIKYATSGAGCGVMLLWSK